MRLFIFTTVLAILQVSTAQHRTTQSLCDEAADIVFVLDTSSSIWPLDFTKQLEFVDSVVSQFNIGPGNTETRVGVMTFARYHYVKFKLNKYNDVGSVREAIKQIKHKAGPATNTGDALKFLSRVMFEPSAGSRKDLPHIAIVITDGRSQRGRKTLEAAKAAQEKGIEIYAIGVGPNVKESELRGIASDPDDRYYFTVDDYDSLLAEKDVFTQQACRGRLSTTTTSTTPRPTTTTTTTPRPTTTTTTPQPRTFSTNRQRISTRRTTYSVNRQSTYSTNRRRTSLSTRRRTYPTLRPRTRPTPSTVYTRQRVRITPRPTTRRILPVGDIDPSMIFQACAGKPADIYFLMDASTSIRPLNFERQKSFVKNMVSRFDISQDKTRVGVVTFSNSFALDVPLGSANDAASLYRSIDNITYAYGTTNTAEAIRFVRQNGFTEERRREGVAHIMIVLTDGLSRDPILTKQEAALARQQGIYLFAIGIGNGAKIEELKNIGNEPHDQYVFQVSNFRALDSIKDILASRTCELDQLAKLCGTRDLSDIMFLYDVLTLGRTKSNYISKFIAKVVQRLDISSGNVRIGRMLYDCLDDAYTALIKPSDIHVWSNQVLPGITDLMRRLRASGFADSNGGRSNAKDVAVLFLDNRLHDVNEVTRQMALIPNTHFVTVLIGADETTRLPISSYNRFLRVPSYRELFSYTDAFLEELCPTLDMEQFHIML